MIAKTKNMWNTFLSYDKSTKIKTIVSGAIFIFAIICCIVLCAQTTLIFIDDIMYADWAQHGIKYFFEQYSWHIENFNGRTFVHMCLSILMIGKEFAYTVVMPALFVLIFYGLFTVARPHASIQSKLTATGVGLLCYLALYVEYITTTLIWMAGGFNYIFPLAIITITYLLFLKHKDKKLSVVTILLSFICGATTEQYGMYYIGLIVLTAFFDILESKKINYKSLIYFAASVVGYLTIFIAPGTSERFSNSLNYSASSSLSFIDLLYNNCFYLYGPRGDITMQIIFFFVIGLLGIKNKEKYSKVCISALPAAIVLLLLNLTPFTILSYWVALIETVVICVALCLKKETREQGKLLICGFGTFFMMSITMAAGNRTCVPFILTSIAILTICLYDLAKVKNNVTKTSVALVTLSAILFVSYLPTVNCFMAEKQYCEEVKNQFENSSKTGLIEFDFDKTLASNTLLYRYVTVLDGSSAYMNGIYYKAFNVPDDIKFNIKSEKYNVYNVKIANTYSMRPIIKQDEKILMTTKHLEHLGYTINTGNQCNIIQTKSNIIEMYENGSIIVKTTDGNIVKEYTPISIKVPQRMGVACYYDIEVVKDVFDFEYTINEDTKLVEIW